MIHYLDNNFDVSAKPKNVSWSERPIVIIRLFEAKAQSILEPMYQGGGLKYDQ
jgi:hypothetical protein